MERKNVTFSREGVTVGVKAVGAEEYADKTQRCAHPPPSDLLAEPRGAAVAAAVEERPAIGRQGRSVLMVAMQCPG